MSGKKEIGEVFLRRGAHEEAGRYLAEAVVLAGQQKYEDAPELAEEYADAIADQCPQHAAAMYKSCIKFRKIYKRDLDATYYNKLGRTLRRLGQWREAVTAYMAGTKYSPEDASLYFNTGMAYVEGKEFANAAQVMKKVTELSPYFHTDDIQIAYNMGMIFKKADFRELALKMLQFVQRQDPGYKNVEKMLASLQKRNV